MHFWNVCLCIDIFFVILQAITAAQRRGEDIETTKKCEAKFVIMIYLFP